MEENKAETKAEAKNPTISVNRDEYGKTVVRLTSNTPDEIETMFYDTVESLVEHRQCPPDIIMRAVTHGMIQSDEKVRASHQKERQISNLIFGISMAALAGMVIFSVIRGDFLMAGILVAVVVALKFERDHFLRS